MRAICCQLSTQPSPCPVDVWGMGIEQPPSERAEGEVVFWGTASAQPQQEMEGGLAEQAEVWGSLLTIALWFGREGSVRRVFRKATGET